MSLSWICVKPTLHLFVILTGGCPSSVPITRTMRLGSIRVVDASQMAADLGRKTLIALGRLMWTSITVVCRRFPAAIGSIDGRESPCRSSRCSITSSSCVPHSIHTLVF
jgi:hypothetical protein